MKKIKFELKTDELVGHGKYRIQRMIGYGGSGSVYLAIRLRDGLEVAVKETDRVCGTAEAQVMKDLSRPGCPGIPKLFETEARSGGRMVLIMEYVEGTDLRTLMNRLPRRGSGAERKPAMDGWLSAEEVIDWSVQICLILSRLHHQTPPVIYRDLKPSNLMLDEEGTVFLVDYGSARYFRGNLREDTERLGTRGYAAPEQFGEMGESDARTDIYGFGKVLWQLTERICPDSAEQILKTERKERCHSRNLLTGIFRRIQAERPGARASGSDSFRHITDSSETKAGLEQLAQWCCRPEREERPPDVETVLDELESLRTRRSRKRAGEQLFRKALGTAAAAVLAAAVFTAAMRSFAGQAHSAAGTSRPEGTIAASTCVSASGSYLSASGHSRHSRDSTSSGSSAQDAAKQETIAELNEAPADAQIYERLLDEVLADDVITADERRRIEQCFYSVPKKNNPGGRTALELFQWKNPPEADQFLYEYGTACFFCLEGGRPTGEALLKAIRDEQNLSEPRQKLLRALRTLDSGGGEEIWAALSAFTMNAAPEDVREIRPFYLESLYNEQISLIILSWAENASFDIADEEIDDFLEDMGNYMKEGDSDDSSDAASDLPADPAAARAGSDSEDTSTADGGGAESETGAGSGTKSGNQNAGMSQRMLRAENEELLESVKAIRQGSRP